MPTTPALGLPYPTPDDPVSLGANDIRDLAEAVEAKAGVPLFSVFKLSVTAAGGGWQTLNSAGTPEWPAAPIGPGMPFTEYRLFTFVRCDSAAGTSDYLFDSCAYRMWVDNVSAAQWMPGAVSWRPGLAVGSYGNDPGWLPVPADFATTPPAPLLFGFRLNMAGAAPAVHLGCTLWLR